MIDDSRNMPPKEPPASVATQGMPAPRFTDCPEVYRTPRTFHVSPAGTVEFTVHPAADTNCPTANPPAPAISPQIMPLAKAFIPCGFTGSAGFGVLGRKRSKT